MVSTDRLAVMAVAFGLVATVACSGGNAGEETSAQQMASAEAESSADDMGSAQESQLPEGVTQEMVDQGREVFGGAGLCYACHGADGTGMPSLGANLTDDEWIHSDGSIEGIAETILAGVPADKSTTGTPMPPKGGSGITDDQVKAVAAFVYTLNR